MKNGEAKIEKDHPLEKLSDKLCALVSHCDGDCGCCPVGISNLEKNIEDAGYIHRSKLQTEALDD